MCLLSCTIYIRIIAPEVENDLRFFNAFFDLVGMLLWFSPRRRLFYFRAALRYTAKCCLDVSGLPGCRSLLALPSTRTKSCREQEMGSRKHEALSSEGQCGLTFWTRRHAKLNRGRDALQLESQSHVAEFRAQLLARDSSCDARCGWSVLQAGWW